MQIQILVSGLPVEGTAYRAGEGVIIHIPDIAQKTGEKPGLETACRSMTFSCST